MFSSKKAGTSPIFKEGNYTIDLIEGKELPYKLLYNLS